MCFIKWYLLRINGSRFQASISIIRSHIVFHWMLFINQRLPIGPQKWLQVGKPDVKKDSSSHEVEQYLPIGCIDYTPVSNGTFPVRC